MTDSNPEEPLTNDNDQDKDSMPEIVLEPAFMDLNDYKVKVDHFENIHTLPDDNKVEGAPNFRQVRHKGFPIPSLTNISRLKTSLCLEVPSQLSKVSSLWLTK